jgi:hypothetical protein
MTMSVGSVSWIAKTTVIVSSDDAWTAPRQQNNVRQRGAMQRGVLQRVMQMPSACSVRTQA